jgi:hypothetical protein
MQDFIAVPKEPQRFVPRAQKSLSTSLAFIVDQRWASLIFLLVYLGLIYWDYLSTRMFPTPPPPDWTTDWPEAMNSLKLQLAREALGTWRSLLAGFVVLLYWGNALLYIAERSTAFASDGVVGLGRFLLRGVGIALILVIPLILGLALLIIPGLLVAGTLIAAAGIAMFHEQTIFRAIGAGYRLVTESLRGQARVLGFSRSFVHIVAAYGLVITMSLAVTVSLIFVASGLAHFFPAQELRLSYAQTVLSNLIGSFLNLSFSIFVLNLYAEYRMLVRR